MNLPNQLTVLRLVLTIPFVFALSSNFPGAKALALALFLAGGATDYLDGYLARKLRLATDFGKLMDPLVDKIMTASAFICLVSLRSIPAWAAIVIVSREFLITGLRLIALSRGKVLPAERLGKHKMLWQIITILYFLILLTINDLFVRKIDQQTMAQLNGIGTFLILVTVGLTLFSGIAYLTKHWDLLRDH